MKKLIAILILLISTGCEALNTRPPVEPARKPMLHEQMRGAVWGANQTSPSFLWNVGE